MKSLFVTAAVAAALTGSAMADIEASSGWEDTSSPAILGSFGNLFDWGYESGDVYSGSHSLFMIEDGHVVARDADGPGLHASPRHDGVGLGSVLLHADEQREVLEHVRDQRRHLRVQVLLGRRREDVQFGGATCVQRHIAREFEDGVFVVLERL
jgi:hypothetical protein